MAVGFALNPMAIGAMATDAGMDVYAKHLSDVTRAVGEAKYGKGALKEPGQVDRLRKVITDYMNYYQAQPKDLSPFERFMRMIFSNRLHERIGAELSKQLGEARKEIRGAEGFFKFAQAAMELTARNVPEVSPRVVDDVIEHMLGIRMAERGDIDVIRQIALDAGVAPQQYTEGGALKGRLPGRSLAPLVFVQPGAVDELQFRQMTKETPWLVNVVTPDQTDRIVTHTQLDKDHLLPKVTEDNLDQMAAMLGVSSGTDAASSSGQRGLGVFNLKSGKQVMAEVQRKAEFINNILQDLPEGMGIHLVPSLGILAQRSYFKGMPAGMKSFNDQDDVMVFMRGYWDKANNRIILTPSTGEGDIAEEVLHAILDPNPFEGPDRFYTQLAEKLRSKIPEDAPESDIEDHELVVKVYRVLRFNHNARSQQSFNAFIDRADIGFPNDREADGYLLWRAEQAGFNPDIFDRIKAFGAQFNAAQAKYEHAGYTPEYPLEELLQYAEEYKPNYKKPVDPESFSLATDFREDLHGQRNRE